MPSWYWEKKDIRLTPSHEKGMDYETETRYRREGVRFIMELGKALNLSHNTMATGAVYFHRFYMFHAFQDFPRHVVSTCCLFLAGKAEETPKKSKDIVKMVRDLTNDRQFATFGRDPREEIMMLERVLLQTIKFDLQVEHPYASIIKFAKSLKGDQAKLQKMVQMSWTFVNDSLCTTLCLQWEPEIIAIAVMYLAVKLSKFEVKDWVSRQPNQNHWWDQYVENLYTTDLEEICHQVLDLYNQPVTATKEAAVTPPPGAAPKPAPIAPMKPAKVKPPPVAPMPGSKPATPIQGASRPKSRPQTPPYPPGQAMPPMPPKLPIPPPPSAPVAAPLMGMNYPPRPPLPPSAEGMYPMHAAAGGAYPGYAPPPPPGQVYAPNVQGVAPPSGQYGMYSAGSGYPPLPSSGAPMPPPPHGSFRGPPRY